MAGSQCVSSSEGWADLRGKQMRTFELNKTKKTIQNVKLYKLNSNYTSFSEVALVFSIQD